MTNTQVNELGPVFIVGMNGSGTTMLGDCLDNSDELYVFPRETRLVPWVIRSLDKYGDLSDPANLAKLLDTVSDFSVFRGKLADAPLTVEEIEMPTVAAVFDAVYGRMSTREGTVRWVEHSPMNVQFIPELAAAIPNACFIHIIRDGRDIARSNLRRWNKNPLWSIYRWKQIVRKACRDGTMLGNRRYFEIRYEDLTANPASWIRRIAEFLSIDYGDELLRSSMPFVNTGSRRGEGSQKMGTLVSNSNKWKVYFSESDIRKMEQIAGQELAAHGYEAENISGDRNPSKVTLTRWQIVDSFRLLMVEYKLYGIRGRSRLVLKRAVDWMRFKSVLRY